MILCDIDFSPFIQTFELKDEDFLHIEDKVVVKTQYGNRIGKVIKKYDSSSLVKESILSGVILGIASSEDLKKLADNTILEKHSFNTIKSLINNDNSNMSLLATKYDLDRTSCIIFFASDKMVDFRNLLKSINQELNVKIRLENIGDARTYAKLQGGCGVCGLKMCCVDGYNMPDKVTKKSLKIQNITYNPMTNYGNCNRLKCCLSFEEDLYEFLNRTVPKKGETILYQNRKYTVTNRNLIKEEITVIDNYSQNNDQLKLNVNDIKRLVVNE